MDGGLHTTVYIEDPSRNGNWHCVDFFADGFELGLKSCIAFPAAFVGWPGDVGVGEMSGPPSGGDRHPSSPSEDQAKLDKARGDDANPPRYHLLLWNCGDYSNYIHNNSEFNDPGPRRPPGGWNHWRHPGAG